MSKINLNSEEKCGRGLSFVKNLSEGLKIMEFTGKESFEIDERRVMAMS